MKLLKGLLYAQGTKRALIASAACTLLCGLLLFSTSIAWFTANMESSVNEIYSGNLDVVLSYSKTMNNNDWEPVTAETDNIFKVNVEGKTDPQPMLWEPGAVNVVYFKVENKGSLAAKYDFTVEITEEDEGTNFDNEKFKLSDYIKGGVVKEVSGAFTGDTKEAQRSAAIDAVESAYENNVKTLQQIHTGAPLITDKMQGVPDTDTETAENTTKTFALVLYMPDDVGDVTNYKTGTEQPKVSLKVKLVATQMTGESDSFGTDYDKYAVNPNYTVSNPSALTEALTNAENGAVIGIGGNNIALTQKLDVNKNVTIVGDSEHAIKNYPTYVGANNTVTFKNVKFDETTTGANGKESSVYGNGFKGTLIFDGCTFGNNNWEAIQITPAGDCTIIIRNCTFNGYSGAKRFIHIQPNGNGSNTFKLNVTITNCTFNNCDLVNYNTDDNNKGSVIDLDYFAQGSTITMGKNTFSLSSDVTSYDLHPYFCDATGEIVVTGNDLLNYLTGDIKTYEVTTTNGLQLKAN